MIDLLGRSRFRQISFFFALLLTLFSVSLAGFRAILFGGFYLRHLQGDATTFLVSSIPFWILLFVPETRATHIIQILAMMVFGGVAVYEIAPRDLGGDLAFVIAGGLAYRYGLLDRRRILKLSLIIGTLILIRLAAVITYDDIDIKRAVNQIIIVVFFVPFLYLIFERDFLRTIQEKHKLEAYRAQNRPFVEFGQNVSGIVHDFKNDLALFSSYAEFLRTCEWEPLEPTYVNQLEGYVGRFRNRIDRLLFVTRKRGHREEEVFSLEKAVRSALYVFETSNDFRRTVTFHCRCAVHPIQIRSHPDEFLSILENLIRNSCEALLRAREESGSDPYHTPRVEIHIEHREDVPGVAVVVEDNGPGFLFCGAPDGRECTLDLRDLVRRGDGLLGLGLQNVAYAAERIGADVVLKSARNRGVRATVRLPATTIEHTEIDG